MSLYKCPECGGGIATIANRCPKCTHEYTEEQKANLREQQAKLKKGCGYGCLSMILLFFILSAILAIAVDEPESKPQILDLKLPEGVRYDLRKADDASFGNRKRHIAYIYSNAVTLDERKSVLKYAANQVHQATGAVAIDVRMIQLKEVWGVGRAYGKVTYILDRKGWSGEEKSPTWEYALSDQPPLTEAQEKILTYWEQNKEHFRGVDGALDEGALKVATAERFGINDEVVQEALNASSRNYMDIFNNKFSE